MSSDTVNNLQKDGPRVFRISFTKRKMTEVLSSLNGSSCQYGKYEVTAEFQVKDPRYVKEEIVYKKLKDYKIRGCPGEFKDKNNKIRSIVEKACRPFKVT